MYHSSGLTAISMGSAEANQLRENQRLIRSPCYNHIMYGCATRRSLETDICLPRGDTGDPESLGWPGMEKHLNIFRKMTLDTRIPTSKLALIAKVKTFSAVIFVRAPRLVLERRCLTY